MSALDQAFIKAYSKNLNLTDSAVRAAEAFRAPEPPADEEQLDALATSISPPPYRLDQAPPGSALPAPHARFARTGNTLRSRYTVPPPAEEFLPPPPAPVAQEYPELLPSAWRKKTLGLSKLARQLVGHASAFVADEDSLILVQEPEAVAVVENLAKAETKPIKESPAAASVVSPTVDPSPEASPGPNPLASNESQVVMNFSDSRGFVFPQVVYEALDASALKSSFTGDLPTHLGLVVDTFSEPLKPSVTEKKRSLRFDAASPARGPHFGNKPEALFEADAQDELANEVDNSVAAIEAPVPIAPPESAIAETIKNETTSAETTSVPPAAAVSKAAWEVDALDWPEVITKLTSDPTSYFAQAGQKLTDAVRDGLKMLAVASSQRGEGCTTIALALARIAAQSGLDVAVVDADFAHPEMAERLKLEIPTGWELATQQKIDLGEVAIRAVHDQLTIYSLHKSAELSLSKPAVQDVLAAVAHRHALTIVDLGPLPAGDSAIFATTATAIDAVVVVRDVIRTPIDHIQSVATRLHASGIEAVAIAENFVS